MERPRIVIIGSGNVATHLASAIDEYGDVIQVYSRSSANAERISTKLREAKAINSLHDIDLEADFYLISVKDDVIGEIAEAIPDVNGIVMHTSGSVGIDILSRKGRKAGVLYPLQTFSKDTALDVTSVPFFIEANDAITLAKIETLGRLISQKVYHADSTQRRVLHIAAVFGCNFVNHLLDISSQILGEQGYSLDVLKPLLDVTIDKAMTIGPHKAQTGPAVRKDLGVIRSHMESLPADKRLIYEVLSEDIMNNY